MRARASIVPAWRPLRPGALAVALLATLAAAAAVAAWPGAFARRAAAVAAPAPGFAAGGPWLNSPPLSLAALRGKVVLVEFWTYSCINCLHVLPHVSRWHDAYAGQGLVVVGVHTPEYDEERATANVRAAVERLGIAYPVVQDNAYGIWNAFGNQYWPALYLIDRDGRVVYRHVGEGDYAQTEAAIRAQLARSGGEAGGPR